MAGRLVIAGVILVVGIALVLSVPVAPDKVSPLYAVGVVLICAALVGGVASWLDEPLDEPAQTKCEERSTDHLGVFSI